PEQRDSCDHFTHVLASALVPLLGPALPAAPLVRQGGPCDARSRSARGLSCSPPPSRTTRMVPERQPPVGPAATAPPGPTGMPAMRPRGSGPKPAGNTATQFPRGAGHGGVGSAAGLG